MKSKQGIEYILLASLVFAIMAACSKLLGPEIGVLEQVFIRNLVGFAVVMLSFLKKPLMRLGPEQKALGTLRNPRTTLVVRGIFGSLGLIAQFYNATSMPLGEAMTFFHANVIFTSLFAWLFLKEFIGSKIFAVLLGLAGMVLIFKPSPELFRLDHLISGLGCAIFVGLAYTSVRGLRNYFETRIIVLSLMISGIVLPFVAMPFVPSSMNNWAIPTLQNVPVLIIFCFMSVFGQIWVTKAYALGKASVISTLGLSGIIFGLLLGLILGDPLPNTLSTFGIILVLAAGIWISLNQRRDAIQKSSV